MLYEKKIRLLSNAVYAVFNDNLSGDDMEIPFGDTIKQLIFFEEIYNAIDAKQSLNEIKNNLEELMNDSKHLKAYFIREFPVAEKEMNLISYLEYKRWKKNNKL
jgi:hypothetical protein